MLKGQIVLVTSKILFLQHMKKDVLGVGRLQKPEYKLGVWLLITDVF